MRGGEGGVAIVVAVAAEVEVAAVTSVRATAVTCAASRNPQASMAASAMRVRRPADK